jgi:hypothetical protein
MTRPNLVLDSEATIGAVGLIATRANLWCFSGELRQHPWRLAAEQPQTLDAEELGCARKEATDILPYLARLAGRLDEQVISAARNKIELNTMKHPANQARGSRCKHTAL